jgi:hypothetical protein
MPVQQLSQYPCPPGNRNQAVGSFSGPAAYAQVVPGNPPTGGFQLTAAQLGLVSIEFMTCSLDASGTYNAEVIFPSNFLPNDDVPYVIIEFTLAATGAQVAGATNLSAINWRFQAFGL